MTLRAAAVGAMVIGLGLLFFYLQWIGESPWSSREERHLRAMKERTAAPDSVTPYTFADFAALPHGRPLAEFAALETRAVSLEGYTRMAHLSADGDFHLSLAPTPSAADSHNSVFLSVTAELTPEWQRGSATWQWEPLVARLRPRFWGLPWPSGPRRVRVSGWLLYDFQYDAPFVPQRTPPLQQAPGRRLTGWEIHPVTGIEIWDDSLATFVEYRR